MAAYLNPLSNPLAGRDPQQRNEACNGVGQTQGGTNFPVFDLTSKVDLTFLCCFPVLFLSFAIVYGVSLVHL